MSIVIALSILVLTIINLYLLNNIKYKIDLLWINETNVSKTINNKILNETNKK